MMNVRHAILAALAATVLAADAEAGILYQSIPDLTAAPYVNGWCSTCSGLGQYAGQQFTLAAPATVGSLLFTVTGNYHWPTPVTVSVFEDAGSQTLGTEVYRQTFAQFALDLPTPNNTNVVGVNTPGLSLAAGTYDLFLVNFDDLAIPAFRGLGAGYQILTHDALASGSSYYFEGQGVIDSGLVLQTETLGSIPEPATLLLFGAGLAGIRSFRRNAGRAQAEAA